MLDQNKERDRQDLRAINTTWSYEAQASELLRFIAKQLIDIKYDIKDIKNQTT